jgi:1-acyl-sn-glycerol-3-phosphate acyltransferase
MSDPVSYPVPWDLVFGLWPNMLRRTATSVDAFSASICSRIQPAPLISGWENLPPSARFILVANHYQRRGLWIMHAASVLTQAIRRHYGPGDPPVRWMVTANWPPIKLGPLRFRSPGDLLLPRVADALACYPVSFAGANPAYTARSLRRILRAAPRFDRPLGIFPEGVGGCAGKLTDPIPGMARLFTHLAKHGLPVQPAGISEGRGRLVVRFGPGISCAELITAPDAALLAMRHIARLLSSE